MRNVRFIAGNELKFMIRTRETLLWVFVMPILFFYFIGTVTSGFGPRATGPTPIALTAGENPGFLFDQLERRLVDREYRVDRPETEEDLATYRRHLSVPAGFTDSVLAVAPTTVEFAYAGEGLGSDYENLRVGRAMYSLLADVIVSSEEGEVTEASIERLNAMPRAFTLDVKPAGERKRIPTGFEQAIPGIMVMFILLVMATSGAVLIVTERKEGLLRRLASAPIGRPAIVWGKWIGKLVLGMIQIAFAMIAGTVLFRMDWGPDLAAVIVVLLAYGSMMAALGILLGSAAKTEGQAVGIGVLSANVLAALGGCWWPIEITPAWMQKLQLFIPTGWAMDAMHRLISFQAGAVSVAPHVIGMLIGTVLVMAVAARAFRFE